MTTNELRTPKVSVIIATWTGDASRPMNTLQMQSFADFEIEVVYRINLSALGGNIGARRTRGEILVFLHDDVALRHERVVQQGIDILESFLNVGAVGISRQIPPGDTALQRRVARTVLRWDEPIVTEDMLSDPPLDH